MDTHHYDHASLAPALSNGSVQQMMVCSGAQVTLTCTCTLTTDLWKLPVGTCPDKNDSILLTEGANQNCGGTLGTCGPYRAQGSGPDSSSGRCLTSTLTFVANTTVTILCDLTNQVVISITGKTVMVWWGLFGAYVFVVMFNWS